MMVLLDLVGRWQSTYCVWDKDVIISQDLVAYDICLLIILKLSLYSLFYMFFS